MASPLKNHTRAYRIVSPKYPPFDGSGAYRWGSRWISPGQYVVHAAESYALAVLENLVHWQSTTLPPNLVCVAVDLPDSLRQEELPRSDLPKAKSKHYSAFREIGDDWYHRGDSVALWVPSLVSPVESNLLFNQQHKDFAKLKVHAAVPAQVDPRLLGPAKSPKS